ncbi:hypothetical protein G7Z17_g7916 [Cylindrodendrum hubeiense]|uniref:CHAT domain-containing protein n=1 Tax=Cylindrodendrum hubeiense TaxID=595255 RepID=A0A9P5H687_9HYPO|nr:hypothetical protein G7Z17_g7916 [Cylindrodendrum hubeiense]
MTSMAPSRSHSASDVANVVPGDAHDQATSLNGSTTELVQRYRHLRRRSDLEKAIGATQQGLDAIAQDDPERIGQLSTLSFLMGDRYSFSGNAAYLDNSIDLGQQVVGSMTPDHTDYALHLGNLGLRLAERFDLTGNPSDIENAIRLTRKAVNALSEYDPDRSSYLGNLGQQLGKEYMRTDDESILEEAIEVSRQAVDSTPTEDPTKALWLNNLGNRIHQKFLRYGLVEDLESAIAIARQAVKLTPDEHSHQPERLANLASKLSDGYSRGQPLAYLEEAIELTTQAIEATPPDRPWRPKWLHNLSLEMKKRYQTTGATKDLDDAIGLIRQAIEATPGGSPDRAQWLNTLGLELSHRFSRVGAMADIEEALKAARQAVIGTPKNHADFASYLNNLSNHLRDRHARTNSGKDLDEAISVARRAVKATPKGHPNRSAVFHNLSTQLGTKYSLGGIKANGQDIEDAVRNARRAVREAPEDHPERPKWLVNYGCQLSATAQQYNDVSSFHIQPLDTLQPGLEAKAMGYLQRKAVGALDKAIDVIRQAVRATPATNPERAKMMIHLGDRLGERYALGGNSEDLTKAGRYYATAMKFQNSPISVRLCAAGRRMSSINFVEDIQRAYRIAKATVDLIPQLVPNSLLAADKQQVLEQAVGLASDAAAIALLAGQEAICAIELLERGRGVLAGSLQDLRGSLSALEQEHPELAQSYLDLRNHLDNSTPIAELDPGVTMPVDDVTNEADGRSKAARQMDEILEDIRLQPGFEHFLEPASEEQLLEAAADGPIIILNVSSYRCDALVIDSRGFRVVKLPKLSRGDIVKREETLQSHATLIWLWDTIASPVFEDLGILGIPSGDTYPHIWWIPTGPLIRFPIHAAGHHLGHSFKTVLDRVTSSYSTSIKSMINSRQNQKQHITTQVSSMKILLVSMRETPRQNTLHYADDEIHKVQSVCESMKLSHIQPPACRDKILSALQDCEIFHFAGHADAKKNNPMGSALLLEDWRENPLTVESVFKTNSSKKMLFLAYLSACGTGQNRNDRSIDENIHLTNAFQLTGFRHVIGTLWKVQDEICVSMARLTYEFLHKNGISDENVSGALHHATRQVRDDLAQHITTSVSKTSKALSYMYNPKGIVKLLPMEEFLKDYTRQGELLLQPLRINDNLTWLRASQLKSAYFISVTRPVDRR